MKELKEVLKTNRVVFREVYSAIQVFDYGCMNFMEFEETLKKLGCEAHAGFNCTVIEQI